MIFEFLKIKGSPISLKAALAKSAAFFMPKKLFFN